MNAFYLDEDIYVNASYHCDKHVVKMILEYAQLLSTAHHIHESDIAHMVYRKTHYNHPSAIWARANGMNYAYLYYLFKALCSEYTTRYGKVHKTWTKLGLLLAKIPDKMELGEFYPPPQCMPDQYKQPDTVKAYRAYYLGDKQSFAKWKYTTEPYWWNES